MASPNEMKERKPAPPTMTHTPFLLLSHSSQPGTRCQPCRHSDTELASRASLLPAAGTLPPAPRPGPVSLASQPSLHPPPEPLTSLYQEGQIHANVNVQGNQRLQPWQQPPGNEANVPTSRGGNLIQRGNVACSDPGRTLVPRKALQPFPEM